MNENPAAAMLVCRIGTDFVAIEAAAVREVVPLLPLWRPPGLPRPLAGFARVRARVVPVIAPLVLFGKASAVQAIDVFAHLVVPHPVAGTHFCLLVDRVEALIHPAAGDVRAVAADSSPNGVVVGELAWAEGVAHLLSLDRLLDARERQQAQALAEETARRAAEWRTDAAWTAGGA